MGLKIACQMDPIDKIDIRGDSTFAILLEPNLFGTGGDLLPGSRPPGAQRS